MSARTLTARSETWPLARPFAISRGTKTAAEVVVVDIVEDGRRGRGECVPYARYGETVAGVLEAIGAVAADIDGGLDRQGLQARMPPGAARNAIDCALWDLAAKLIGCPAWRLAGVEQPRPAVTAETISIDRPEVMASSAAQLRDRPLLKVKVGADEVVERIAAVRAAAPAARLLVDANEGWDRGILERVAGALAALGVAVIEQPVPASEDESLHAYRSPVPLCADESCCTLRDLARLPAAYRMVNVKLDKAGGLTEALQIAATARRRGLQVMVGCMVATSLAMAPAMLLTHHAHLVDLDGPLWLARDREPALTFHEGRVHPADPALWG